MIYSVGDSLTELQQITPESFTGLNIWERTHIQEWIRRNPGILGEELLIVAMEFDRFVNSSDRLDLLALDREGNLVVIELKRSPLAGSADLQAIRYAAMVSSMTIKTLTPYYIAYQQRYCGRVLTPNEAESEIKGFVDSDGFTEVSSTPRIILCSEGFSPEITTTVLWLNRSQIDVSCVQITPYKHKDNIIVVPKVIIPLAEAKQYLIEIKSKEDAIEQSALKTRKGSTMQLLLERGLIKGGDHIYLKSALPAWITYDDQDPWFRAVIIGKPGQTKTVRSDANDKEYSISKLTWDIFTDRHPQKKEYGGLSGADHWVDATGRSLSQIAEESKP